MPTYISLINWTDEGIKNVKDSPSRLKNAQAAIAAAGGEMTSFYMTIGRYDMVAVVEAPDDATFAKVMLAISSQGTVRSETLKAFSQDEYDSIVGSL